jgi:glycerol kinase
MTSAPLAIGLDLGSSRIKAATLQPDGSLGDTYALPAPSLWGEGAIREGDAEAYAEVATEVLRAAAAGAPHGTPVGIASQRSSFLLWDAAFGRPLGPYISWQDRRAADWCRRHLELSGELGRRTGLYLSPYYVGPKLAAMSHDDELFAATLQRENALWGNLDSYLLWRWSGGAHHETDITMAARTMLVDLAGGDWDDQLLATFGVPRRALPRIVPSRRPEPRPLLDGLRLTATLADQSAAVLALLPTGDDAVLAYTGTGTFVLRHESDPGRRVPGLLTGPILGADPPRFALEGAINGSGPAYERYRGEGVRWPSVDPSPEAFRIPDSSGLGAPYWRDDVTLTDSPACRHLDAVGHQRVLLEALAFRIAQIVRAGGAPTSPLTLAGGIARDPALPVALATTLGRPVEVLEDHEGGLLGIARLAAGLDPHDPDPARTREALPCADASWLAGKYDDWCRWLETVLGDRSI